MAASITLTNPTVDAAGTTITATLGGGVAPYNITGVLGNILGLFITGGLQGGSAVGVANNFIARITAAAIAGTTLTLTTDTPVGQGETWQVNAAAMVLGDSAANTGSAANVNLINNSTLVVKSLSWKDILTLTEVQVRGDGAGYDPSQGANPGFVRGMMGYTGNDAVTKRPYGYAGIEFVTDATNIVTFGFTGAGHYIRTDGTTYAGAVQQTGAFASGANGWVQKSYPALATMGQAAGGLTGGKHFVQLNVDDYLSVVRLWGGTRLVETVPTVKRRIIANQIPGVVPVDATGLPAATVVNVLGPFSRQGNGDTGARIASYAGTLIEFGFSGASGVEILCVLGVAWAVVVDGQPIGPLVSTGIGQNNVYGVGELVPQQANNGQHTVSAMVTGAFQNTVLNVIRLINATKLTAASLANATTLTVASVATIAVGDWVSIANEKTREVRQVTGIAGLVLTLDHALEIAHAAGDTVRSVKAPAAGTVTAYASRVRNGKRYVAMGDSNTAAWSDLGQSGAPDANGLYYNLYDPRQSPFQWAADRLGWDVVNLGVQGNTSLDMVNRQADIAGYGLGAATTFDVMTIFAGTNDINGNVAMSPAGWKANMVSLINTAIPYLRTGGKIIVMPTPTPVGVTNAQGLNLAQEKARIAELVAAYPGIVVDGSPAVARIDTAVDVAGLHYHDSGHTKIAQDLIPLLTGNELFVNGGNGYPFPVAALAKA